MNQSITRSDLPIVPPQHRLQSSQRACRLLANTSSESRNNRPAFNAILAVLLFSLLAGPLRAEVDIDKSLQSIRHNPWYDSSTGEYKAPEYKPVGDIELRSGGWKAKVVPAPPPNPAKPATPNSNFNWNFDFLSNAMTVLVIVLLAIAVVAVVLYALRYQQGEAGRSKKQTKTKKIVIDAARMIDLPFNVDETSADPLEACRRLMAAEDFNRAIVYLYSYELLALEQSNLIRLSKGKTNRMYLGELGPGKPLTKLLGRTIHCFEAVYFGKHRLTAEQFQQVWGQLDEFHHQIELEAERRTAGKAKDSVAVVPGGAIA